MLQRHVSISMYSYSVDIVPTKRELRYKKLSLFCFLDNIRYYSVCKCYPRALHTTQNARNSLQTTRYLRLMFHLFPRMLILDRRLYSIKSINFTFLTKRYLLQTNKNNTNHRPFFQRVSSFRVCHRF